VEMKSTSALDTPCPVGVQKHHERRGWLDAEQTGDLSEPIRVTVCPRALLPLTGMSWSLAEPCC